MQYDDGEVELYDLEADPSETRDVSGDEPEVVAELEACLDASTSDSDSTLGAPEIDAETLRNLESLGYVQ